MNLAVRQPDGAGAIEEAPRSARRSYNREYERRHRRELTARKRERYQARIPRVDSGVLSAARQDPRYEQKHAITKYVICRVVDCGARAKRLNEAHLRNLHQMTTAQYMKLFPGAPLLSSAVREAIGARQLGRRMRNWNDPNHAGERPLRLWLVAEGTVHGKSFAEIAKPVHRRPNSVRECASRLGLGSGWRRRFDLGSRVTYCSLLRLLKGTGFDSRRFAKVFAIPAWVAGKSLEPSRVNYDVSPIHANSIIDSRDQLIRKIDRLSRTARRWGPNLSKCLRSLVPDLPQICRALQRGLALSRDYLKANPKASITDWQDWLCDEAFREIAQERRDAPFAAFLPLAVELSPMIEAELDSIRSVGEIIYVAARILRARFSLGAVPHALRGARVDRLPPLELQVWILSALAQKRDPGRPPEWIYSKALADLNKGLTMRQTTQKHLATYYRRNPEGAMDQMKKGVERLRRKQ